MVDHVKVDVVFKKLCPFQSLFNQKRAAVLTATSARVVINKLLYINKLKSRGEFK